MEWDSEQEEKQDRSTLCSYLEWDTSAIMQHVWLLFSFPEHVSVLLAVAAFSWHAWKDCVNLNHDAGRQRVRFLLFATVHSPIGLL